MIRCAQNGDAAAFETLVAPHETRLYQLCLRYTNQREDAHDCAQEAMIRIYRSLPEYRFQAAFSTWIYRITTNICLDYLRKRRARPQTSLDALSDAGYYIPDPKKPPEEALADQDRMAALQLGITKLPPKMRTALILRDMQGLSYEEVASIMRVNLGTAKSRISRAREYLRNITNSILEHGQNVDDPKHTIQEQKSGRNVQPRERRKLYDM